MSSKFFNKHRSELSFEWNAATPSDWLTIRRNFVAAFIHAYRSYRLSDLGYKVELQQQAEHFYQKSVNKGLDNLIEEIIKPLQFYLHYEKSPLDEEIKALEQHYLDPSYDVSKVRENIIKLIMLQHNFEADFYQEHRKILSASKKLDYLIVRFHGQPIAFFVTELYYAHVYLRFITIAPAFHRLGLGEMILEQVDKHYPDATGMDLYTRNTNSSSHSFYKKCGFREFKQFDFKELCLDATSSEKLYFPSDDGTDDPESCIGFSRTTHSYHG